MPLSAVGNITSRAAERAKEEALKPFYNQIDSLLTSKAKAFFEMADGFSDVVVQKGNIELVNAYAKPDAVRDAAPDRAPTPLTARSASCAA